MTNIAVSFQKPTKHVQDWSGDPQALHMQNAEVLEDKPPPDDQAACLAPPIKYTALDLALLYNYIQQHSVICSNSLFFRAAHYFSLLQLHGI